METVLVRLLAVAEEQLDQSATKQGLINCDVIAKARRVLKAAEKNKDK